MFLLMNFAELNAWWWWLARQLILRCLPHRNPVQTDSEAGYAYLASRIGINWAASRYHSAGHGFKEPAPFIFQCLPGDRYDDLSVRLRRLSLDQLAYVAKAQRYVC